MSHNKHWHTYYSPKKMQPTESKQILVTNANVNFVADDLIPLPVVDSKQCRSLLSSLDSQYQLPNHKQLSTVLSK